MQWVADQNRILARQYAQAERVHAHVGDTPEWTAFVRDNRATPVARLLRLGDLDSCGAMGTQLLELLRHDRATPTPEEQQVLTRIAHWIQEQQERLPDGTLWRKAQRDEDHGWPDGTLWADDLYMACPFLVRWAAFTGNNDGLTDAAKQVIHMAARLQDADGLWFHGFSVPRAQHSPVKWGRANGWVAVTLAEILSVLPQDHPDRPALLEICRRQVNGLLRVQPASGLWRQVLDQPESWEETSCTAMFAYAIARGVNRGWLPAEDRRFAGIALAALCARCLSPEGVVKGTCEGTGIGLRLDYYASRKRPDDDAHGPGPLLLAGTEWLNPQNPR
jgi:rhamnogalacturonyl hydrolase YesR